MTHDRTSTEAVALTRLDLHPCSCLTCRREVLHWPELVTEDGRPGTLDLECFAGDELLSLHGCHFDLGPEDRDEPDWGWLED
jgi:hypothetical protein